MKTLVAYFSVQGTTEKVAKALAKETGADLYEIAPQVPYTAADLDWHDKNSRTSVEMADKACRPALADGDAKIAEYDRVFVGFPIWWYEAPRIVQSFLEAYDFAGKTVIPFATSGGSDMGRTAEILKRSCPEAHMRAGKVLRNADGAALRLFAEENK